ncbi:condensation domain-containing protein [Nonomuraea sp. NPDC049655]|uniref:condensation domain-containing protein n=1 Tax=Nonomuraea sp. NPDC049655 TaxID=3364355 RepID=UPI0037BDF8AA
MASDRIVLSYNQIRRLERDATVFAGREREAHHVATAFDFEGPVSALALRRAVQGVIRRHSALRTTFHREVDGEPYGRVLPAEAPDEVLREIQLADSALGLDELTKAEMDRLFDLEGDYKLRGLLVWSGETSARFVLTAEHLVCDGQSFDRVLAEISAAYNTGRPAGESAPDFFTWAERERMDLAGAGLEARLAFWRRRLDPLEAVPEIRLAGMREPARGRERAACLTLPVTPEVVDDLRRCCAANAASLHIGVLTALQLAVFATTGRTVVGVVGPVSLPTQEADSAIGWFSNLGVFRTRIDSGSTSRDLLAAARDTVFDTIDHLIPLPLLVAHLQPGREAGLRWRPWLYLDTNWWAEDPLPLDGLEVSRVDDTFVPSLRPGVGVWANVNGPAPHLFMQWEDEAWTEDGAAAFLQAFADCLRLIARLPLATCAEITALVMEGRK